MCAQTYDTLLHKAEIIIRHMEAIRSMLDMAEEQDIASSGLTLPQIAVLRQLNVEDGLSLKELSERLGLAHSTVSGIVDRLERRDLLHRRPDANDKRFTRIYADPKVIDYVNTTYYSRRSELLAEILAEIPPADHSRILEVFEKLHDLLNSVKVGSEEKST
jgi:DNA-binding MarR family transcriptional regulator